MIRIYPSMLFVHMYTLEVSPTGESSRPQRRLLQAVGGTQPTAFTRDFAHERAWYWRKAVLTVGIRVSRRNGAYDIGTVIKAGSPWLESCVGYLEYWWHVPPVGSYSHSRW